MVKCDAASTTLSMVARQTEMKCLIIVAIVAGPTKYHTLPKTSPPPLFREKLLHIRTLLHSKTESYSHIRVLIHTQTENYNNFITAMTIWRARIILSSP